MAPIEVNGVKLYTAREWAWRCGLDPRTTQRWASKGWVSGAQILGGRYVATEAQWQQAETSRPKPGKKKGTK